MARRNSLQQFQARMTMASIWFAIVGLTVAGTAASAPAYRVTDLYDLPGGYESSLALDINNVGQVVGLGSALQGGRAFIWSAAAGMQDLGASIPGNGDSLATAINNAGAVVGRSGAGRPFLWTEASGATLLGTAQATAWGISDAGQVVGQRDKGGFEYEAFIWTASTGMQSLGYLAGGTDSRAFGINSAGQVVGYSNGTGASSFHAFLWSSSGGMQDLGDLPGGSSYSTATAINQAGTVVGGSFPGPVHHAFTWSQSAGMIDLGSGDSYSIAMDINRHGQVVGQLGLGPGVAALWTEAAGVQDLNALIATDDPLKGTVRLLNATAINDLGQIVGYGDFNGAQHAFLLTPVPEPAAAFLALAAFGVLGCAARSRKGVARDN